MIDNQDILLLGSLKKESERLKNELETLEKQNNIYSVKPIPAREGVEIDVYNDLVKRSGTIIISADGPFVATEIVASMRWTSSYIFEGYWRFPGLLQCYYEYQATGTHRKRQRTKVPSDSMMVSFFDYYSVGHFPLIPHDVFAKTSTITIWIEPIVGGSNFDCFEPGNNLTSAKMWIGFNGFYLVD